MGVYRTDNIYNAVKTGPFFVLPRNNKLSFKGNHAVVERIPSTGCQICWPAISVGLTNSHHSFPGRVKSLIAVKNSEICLQNTDLTEKCGLHRPFLFPL